MSFNGVRSFRYALLAESAANIGSFIPMLFFPETIASLIFKHPDQITAASKSLIQWTGCVVFALTVPLLLSYPNPNEQSGDKNQTVPWRRLTYMTLGAGELALGTVMGAQYLSGESGIKDGVLIGGVGVMGAALGLRVLYLVVRPSWMEAQANARKAL